MRNNNIVPLRASHNGHATGASVTMSEVEAKLFENPKFRKETLERQAMVMAAACIRDARLNAGLSQQQLAKSLCVSQARVAALESGIGKLGPSVSLLMRIAHACGRNLEFRMPLGEALLLKFVKGSTG